MSVAASVKRKDLVSGPLYPTLIKFAVPLMLANILQTTYNLVDSVIVGRLIGKEAFAAVTVCSDILLVITMACNGLSNGVQALIGQSVGAHDREAVRKGVGSYLTIFVGIALVISLTLLILSRPILIWLNTPKESMEAALVYSITCYIGLIGQFGYAVAGAILRGMGDSKGPLLFVAIASVLNLILDIVFISAFHLGTFGAALATVVSQALSFIASIIYMRRLRETYGFDFKLRSLKPDKEMSGKLFRVGIPIMLQNTLMQITALVTYSFIFAYGSAATSVTGIGNRLSTLAMIVTNSLNRAGGSMVAQSVGAGMPERIKKTYLFNAVVGGGFALVLSGLMIFFCRPVFGFFVNDPDVLELSVAYLPALIIQFFCFASRSCNLALINGIGLPKLNLAIGILDGIVFRLGVALLLGSVLGFGLQGYWLGIALGGLSSSFIGIPYFISGKWRNAKRI